MNRSTKNLIAILSAAVMLGMLTLRAAADPGCETHWDPVNQVWVTVCSGGSGGGDPGAGGGDPGGDPGGNACTPGTTVVSTVIVGGGGLCEVWEVWHDACTGQVSYAKLVDIIDGGSCTSEPGSGGTAAANPCIVFNIGPGGVFCQTDWGIEWLLEASVSFPSAFLDLRPYPVTLVNWASAARNGGTPPAAGSGGLDYIAYGGGDPDDPELGDWQDVTLTLRLTPASPVMFFSMPTIGTMALLDVGSTGPPTTLFFDLPSHPEAGANVLAGEIGLGEVPADLPVFSGSAVTAYRLFWSLRFEEYDRDCRPGPDPLTGSFHCRTSNQVEYDNGHWEYGWENRGMGGEITPQMVANLPAGMGADLDGDGSLDAYWNRKIGIRRMDNAGRINGPWAGSWSWGGAVYWAVREGQGQISWP